MGGKHEGLQRVNLGRYRLTDNGDGILGAIAELAEEFAAIHGPPA